MCLNKFHTKPYFTQLKKKGFQMTCRYLELMIVMKKI